MLLISIFNLRAREHILPSRTKGQVFTGSKKIAHHNIQKSSFPDRAATNGFVPSLPNQGVCGFTILLFCKKVRCFLDGGSAHLTRRSRKQRFTPRQQPSDSWDKPPTNTTIATSESPKGPVQNKVIIYQPTGPTKHLSDGSKNSCASQYVYIPHLTLLCTCTYHPFWSTP